MKKTTQELIEIMKSSNDYSVYLESNSDAITPNLITISQALTTLLKDKKLVKADVIAQSGIEIHYAYQILSGIKTPTRDKVIMFCIGMKLTVEETQQLLKTTGYPQLYGKSERDNAILFGLTKMLSLIDLNALLYDLHLDILE